MFTGVRIETDNPRELFAFIEHHSAILQRSNVAQEFNFAGFCMLQGVRHALETKLHGSDVAGAMPSDDEMYDAFVCPAMPMRSGLLH